VGPLHKNLMNPLFPLLSLILAGRLESSFFNFEMIEVDELKSISSTKMPNITTSSNVSREIGVGPESANRGLYGIAAAASSSAIMTRPTTSSVDPFASPSESAATSPIAADLELSPSASPQNEMHSSGNSFDPRSSNVLSSQASNNHSRRLVVPNFQPSSGPSPTSLQPPNTLSESLNNERVPKRAREESPIDLETENYITSEVKMAQFRKPEKKAAYRTVIELIAQNDYEGFHHHEPVFKAAFNNRDYLNCDKRYRMFYYIIRFGATNFLRSFLYLKVSREFNEYSNMEEAFDQNKNI
jgi:hypothetical protein